MNKVDTLKSKTLSRSTDGLRERVRAVLKVLVAVDRLFGIDTRSLALFRVGLASVLLVELTERARNLTAFYTDQGIMPRSFIIENTQNVWSFSLHLASGSFFFQAFLFFWALVAAVALLFGYRTRLATFFSWLLLVSLFVRNPEVQSSGDILISLLLFWSMFLPLGLEWSVDRARATNEENVPQRVLSTATAAVLIQAMLVYLFGWWLKSGEPWRGGSAVWLALNWDQGTTALGRAMLDFPALLTFATHSVLLFELVGPFLLFLPFYTFSVRSAVIPLFILLHLSFALMMTLGVFPFVSMVSVLPFLPSRFWNIFGSTKGEGITILYDGGCGFCKKMVLLIRTFFVLPQTLPLPTQEDPDARESVLRKNSWVVRDEDGKDYTSAAAMKVLLHASPLLWPFHYLFNIKSFVSLSDKIHEWVVAYRLNASHAMRWFQPQPLRWRLPLIGQFVVGLLLLHVVVWNLAGALDFNAPLKPVARLLQIHQHWSMFAPYPRLDDGWFVVPGILKNGEEIDVFRAVVSNSGEKISWNKPDSVSAIFPDVQWRKYMENLQKKGGSERYQNFAAYLYRTWNASQPEERHLTRLDVYYMMEHTYRLSSPPEKIHLWEHHFSE